MNLFMAIIKINSMKQVVYSIEGNIGSGKTVLIHLLSKRIPNIIVAP